LALRVVDSTAAAVADISLGTLHVNGWTRRFDVPPVQVSVRASFGDQVELLGYDLPERGQEKEVLDLVLYWRALSEMEVSYATFVHLLDASGQVVGQVDHAPGDGAYPTTGWLAGEVVADEFKLPWPPGHSPETVQLEVGLYDPATLERLPAVDKEGQSIGTQVLLPLAQQ
jgi:hypothetical protein